MRHKLSTTIVRIGRLIGSRFVRHVGFKLDDRMCGPNGHYHYAS